MISTKLNLKVTSPRRKILAVMVDRANYGRMRMVLKAIKGNPKLELQVMCSGSMVLERFGNTIREVLDDGIAIDSKVFMELEGSTPLSMAKSLGFGVIEFSSEIKRLRPDIVLIIGDRYEAMAATLAAAYMNVPIAHIQGGEISGSIDESTRHAISKFAHYHFPATERSAEYLYRMGESKDRIHRVGCPVGDYILQLDDNPSEDVFNAGSGASIDVNRSFNLVIFHPVTTAFGSEREQVRELIGALDHIGHPTVFLWPNIDAGADRISKELRIFRENHTPSWLRFVTNLSPVDFQKVLMRTTVAIGNSSSFVRDTTFSGTPVVLVGDRQVGRELGNNAICVPPEREEIQAAFTRQMKNGRYNPDTLYGDGDAAGRIAEILSNTDLYVQKRLDYPNREE